MVCRLLLTKSLMKHAFEHKDRKTHQPHTIFLRLRALVIFPSLSLSFFFVSFFFLGPRFFFPRLSLSDVSPMSSPSSKWERCREMREHGRTDEIKVTVILCKPSEVSFKSFPTSIIEQHERCRDRDCHIGNKSFHFWLELSCSI